MQKQNGFFVLFLFFLGRQKVDDPKLSVAEPHQRKSGCHFSGYKIKTLWHQREKKEVAGEEKDETSHQNNREKNPNYNVLLFHQLLHQGWINEWCTGTGRSPLSLRVSPCF